MYIYIPTSFLSLNFDFQIRPFARESVVLRFETKMPRNFYISFDVSVQQRRIWRKLLDARRRILKYNFCECSILNSLIYLSNDNKYRRVENYNNEFMIISIKASKIFPVTSR